VLISLKASTQGLFAFELAADGAAVGWVRTGRVGFHGFHSHHHAVAAGNVAADVIAQWYATRWRGVPVPWSADTPRIPIISNEIVVGRILEAHDVELKHRAPYGIEICLPPETWTALLLEVAQRTHSAIVAAGLEIRPSRVEEGIS
jgi:hypothetical protein